MNIAKSVVLFGKYRMSLNQYKYDIEVQDDGAIKRNPILFDFMQQTFSYIWMKNVFRYIQLKNIN